MSATQLFDHSCVWREGRIPSIIEVFSDVWLSDLLEKLRFTQIPKFIDFLLNVLPEYDGTEVGT